MAIVPVFVSSTFRDFHGERDVLVGPVRERLDEMVRDLGCRVEMIDLRWGVDTLGVDEDEAARRVVDVCLAEVRRSRPLFLGLIGDRVGYIPDAVHARWVADSVGVPADQPVEGHSVTELEFGFGMLWPSAPTGEHVVLFREVDGPAPEGWRDPDTARLTAFRQQIESRAASTTRYRVTLAPEGAAPQLDRIITDGPSASFEDLLVDRLSGPVRRRAGVIAARARDASSAAERLFRDDHRQAVGRGAMIHDVTARIAAGQRVVLTGESGSGKSTVLCAAEDQLRAQGAVVIGVLLGATAIGGSARRMVEVLAQRLVPVLGRQLQVPEDASADALVEWWRQIVTETAARETRLVLVVDTLDALTEAAVARDVWPIRIAASALRVLCSTTSDDQAHALAASGFAAIRVDKLDGAGAAAAAQWWSKQSGRALPRPVLDVIAAEPRSPLWVRLAVDLLADLDADDFARIAGDDDQATALANLLLAEVRDMHSETTSLAGQYLTRLAERIGSEPSHVLLGVLATAHSGMAPADLAQALGRYPDGSRMVAVASRILGSQLRQADETGRLRFAHQAVQQVALVAGPVDADKRIVEVLDTDRVWDDADALDVIWHAIAAVPTTSSDELNGLAQTFARALDSRPHSAERVLAHALDVEPAGVALIECLADNGISLAGFGPLLRALAFADARHIDKQSRVRFAEAVLETTRRVAADGVTREVLWGLINLADTLESAGEKSRVAPLLDEALRLARLLRQQNSTLVRPVRDLIMCLEEVADRRTSLGDIASAQPLYEEALELARWLWQQTPHDAEAASDLSNALTQVAGMRRETGDLGTASAMLEESLALRRQLHTAQPGSLAAASSLAGALAKAGEMALTHGNITRACELFDEALAWRRWLAHSQPTESGPLVSVSKALTRLGDARETQGALTAALALFEEAVGILDSLRAGEPDRFASSLVAPLQRVGEIKQRLGDLAGAQQATDRSAQFAQQSLLDEPDDVERIRNVSVLLEKSGDLLVQRGDARQALALYEDALHFDNRILALKPGSLAAAADVGVTLNKIATTRRSIGDNEGAKRAASESVSIRRRVRDAQPTSVEAARSLSVSLVSLGDVERTIGNGREAKAAFDEALDIRRGLQSAQPGAVEPVEDLGAVLERLGDLKYNRDDFKGALKIYDEALDMRRWVAQHQPESVEAAVALSSSLDCVGRSAGLTNDLARAIDACGESLAIARRLYSLRGGNPSAKDQLVQSIRNLEVMYRFDGQRRRAKELLREAERLERGR